MALPFLILSASTREAAFATTGTGYRPGGAHRPAAALLSLAIVGGVGATLALALVAPAIEEFFPAPITGTHVPAEPVEPDPTPEPMPQPPTSIVTAVKPLVEIPRFTAPPIGEIVIDPGPLTTVIPPDFGTGGGGTVIEPPRTPVFRGAIRDPRFAGSFQPNYPTSHIREGIEGSCPVTVTIAPTGRVSAVRSAGCADTAFFAATERQAMRSWRFRPATRDGVAVESTQTLTVTFRIDSDD